MGYEKKEPTNKEGRIEGRKKEIHVAGFIQGERGGIFSSYFLN